MLPPNCVKYAKAILNNKISTMADFFKSLDGIKPFNDEINKIKYPNAMLIPDFQIAINETKIFIETLNILLKNQLVTLYFNNNLKDSISVIQHLHQRQKFELSHPIQNLIYDLIKKEIRITDKKTLSQFIKHSVDHNSDPDKYSKKSIWHSRINNIIGILGIIVIILTTIYLANENLRNRINSKIKNTYTKIIGTSNSEHN